MFGWIVLELDVVPIHGLVRIMVWLEVLTKQTAVSTAPKASNFCFWNAKFRINK